MTTHVGAEIYSIFNNVGIDELFSSHHYLWRCWPRRTDRTTSACQRRICCRRVCRSRHLERIMFRTLLPRIFCSNAMWFAITGKISSGRRGLFITGIMALSSSGCAAMRPVPVNVTHVGLKKGGGGAIFDPATACLTRATKIGFSNLEHWLCYVRWRLLCAVSAGDCFLLVNAGDCYVLCPLETVFY